MDEKVCKILFYLQYLSTKSMSQFQINKSFYNFCIEYAHGSCL